MIDIELPRAVVAGGGALEKLPELTISCLLRGKALLITGNDITGEIAEKEVLTRLPSQKMDVRKVDDVSLEILDKMCTEYKGADYSAVFGVGGGKIIDTAKLLGFRLGLPFYSIPTAAAHDGIGSGRASFKFLGKPTSVAARIPRVIVADTNIIIKAPHRLLAAGCGDLLAKFTAVRDWQMARDEVKEEYMEHSAQLALLAAKMVMGHADEIGKHTHEGVNTVVGGLLMSGLAMALANSSRPGSGSEHAFSHALDWICEKPALHGEQCGVGAIIMAYLQKGDWQGIRDALRTIGAPTTAKQLNIQEEDIIKALTIAHEIRTDRYTVLGKGLKEEAAREAAEATGVI